MFTPLPSEDDESDESSKVEQTHINEQTVNREWPSTCHYSPAGPNGVIKIRKQPSDLQAIIKLSINKVIGDAIHETAYRAVDKLVGYHRHILWSSAKSLHVVPFAKRFGRDVEFGKAIGRVVCVLSFVTGNTDGSCAGFYS